jgi:DNA-binding NarL/FixJ family response regulator
VTSVLIVAASAVVRAGLETILSGRPSVEVAGSVADGAGLDDAIERLAPDVVLIDLETAGPPGTVVPPLTGDDGGPAYVLLSDRLDAAGTSDALRQGARAVLPRGADAAAIAAAVEAAAAGLVVLVPESAALLPVLSSGPRPLAPAGVESLTRREIEVLGMLAEGMGNKQIARRLGISEHTVKFHVGSILAKLGAGSRTEAVTLGLRQGLIMV